MAALTRSLEMQRAAGGEVLITTPQVLAALERLGIAPPPVVRTVDAADVTRPEGDYVMAYEHNVVNGALAAVAAAEVLDRLNFPHAARHLALEVFTREKIGVED